MVSKGPVEATSENTYFYRNVFRWYFMFNINVHKENLLERNYAYI